MNIKEYPISSAVPLGTQEYFTFLLEGIKSAKRRVYASIFIINPRVFDDVDLQIRTLIRALSAATKRRVDVKILNGGSDTPDIFSANYVSHHFLKTMNIQTRKFNSKATNNLHSKYCLIDDELNIVGSANWSPGAVSHHVEDSIAVYSKKLNAELTKRFVANWNTSSDTY